MTDYTLRLLLFHRDTLAYSSTAHEHTHNEEYDEDQEQDPGDLRRSASNTSEAEHRRDETDNEKRYRPTEHDLRSSFPLSSCASCQGSNCYAIHDKAKTSLELLLLITVFHETGLRLGDVRKLSVSVFRTKVGRACANFLTASNVYDWSLPNFIDSNSCSPIRIRVRLFVQRFDPVI